MQSELTDEDSERKRGIPLLWRVVLILAALLLVTAGVLLFLAVRTTSNALQAKLEEIERSSAPVSIEEVVRRYNSISGGAEAADEMMEVLHAYREFPVMENEHILFVGPNFDAFTDITQEHLKVSKRHLERNADYLEHLQNVLARHDKFRYPVAIENLFNGRSRHFDRIETGVNMLLLQATLSAARGEEVETLRSIRHATKLADSLRDEPAPISQMARMEKFRNIANAVEEIVNRFALSGESLQSLQDQLGALDATSWIRPALEVERCYWIYSSSDEAVEDSRSRIEKWRADYALLSALNVYDELLIMGASPPGSWPAEEKRIRKLIKSNYFIRWSMFWTSTHYYDASNWGTARLKTAELGLAAKRFELERNRLPESLAELVPDYVDGLPLDPFTGGPMMMRSADGGFVVYSLSSDRGDDGGVERKGPNGFRETGDIVFDVRRAGKP